MITKSLFYLFTLTLLSTHLSSCSTFLSLRGEDDSQPHIIERKKQNFCPRKVRNRFVYAASDRVILEDFKLFLERIKPQPSLTFIEVSILYILAQMNYRPDLAAPDARLQVMLKLDGKDFYYDFFKSKKKVEQDDFSLLHGLDTLIKNHPSNHSLLYLANLLDRHYPKEIRITKEFSESIAKNQNLLIKNPTMKSFFIRANQSLRPGESIQKVNYTKLIRLFRENKKESEKSLEINSHLFPYTPPLLPHQAKITCNFDFNLYDHSIFIEDYHPKKGHPVALRDSRGNSLLGVANLSYNEILPFDESFLFKGDSPSRGKAFCMINNHTIKNNIYMMSYGAYDSAQHLYHLLQYNAPTSTSLMELDQFLRFPRHLFMLNPPRMIYESGRSSKEQLQSFLSLNFPIYHYRNLGHIWSFAHFESFKQFGLLLDDREESTLSCLENL